MTVQRLPDFVLHAVRAPSTDPGAPCAAEDPATAVALYAVLEEWPDPLDLSAGVVVRYLGADARKAYFGAADDEADPAS